MHRYIYNIFKHFLVPSNSITVCFAFCEKKRKTKMKSQYFNSKHFHHYPLFTQSDVRETHRARVTPSTNDYM